MLVENEDNSSEIKEDFVPIEDEERGGFQFPKILINYDNTALSPASFCQI